MNPNMLNKLKKMQKQIQEAQEQIESSEFIGKASGVTVIMQGTRQVIDVKIDEAILDEVELLQDAILLAVKDRKSTRLNSSHVRISYAVFCLKKKIKKK